MEVCLLEGFEQRRLFAVVRWLTLIGIAVLSIFVLVNLVLWSGFLLPGSTKVTPGEVAAVVSPSNPAPSSSDPSADSVFAGITIPARAGRYLGDEQNKSVLEGWLRDVEADQRQEFMDNLEEVIRYAEQNNLDVVRAVNTYKTLKFQRYHAAESKTRDAKLSRYGILGGIVAALMLIVGLSLVLVVLAIERNTRTKAQAENSI